MNNKSNKPINSLIFSQSENDAEQVASQLKNQGLAIRHQVVTNSETLSGSLAQKQWQLALILENSEQFGVDQIAAMLTKQDYYLPIIAALDEYSEQTRSQLMAKGISDCLSSSQNDLLGHIIRREQKLVDSETELQQAIKDVAETSKRNELLLDSSKDAIAYIHEGMHIYTNPTYSERFGYDSDDLIILTIMDLIASEDTQNLKDLLKKQSQQGEEVSAVLHGKKQDGTTFEASFIISSAVYDEEQCIQLLVREEVDTAEFEKRLKEATQFDPVSGLYNRPIFMEHLDTAVKQSVDKKGDSLIFYVEIDNYLNYQQEFGLAACDELISGIATWLRQNAPDTAKIGRISDSSFSILVSSSDTKPSELAKKLCDTVKQNTFDAAGQTLKITVSIGVVTTGDNDLSGAKLIAHANTVCQKVSDDGGDDFKIFNPSIDSILNEQEMALYDEFQIAREAKHLTLFYQPMLALNGSANKQYFSFLRYKSADDKWILGANMFGIFEKLGIDEEIDRIGMVHCLNVLAKQSDTFNVFVSIGSGTLLREDLALWLTQRIRAAKLTSGQIILTINNTVAQSYLNRIVTLKESLDAINVGLCVNNLGINDKELITSIKPEYISLENDLAESIKQEGTDKLKDIIQIANQAGVKTIVNRIEDASVLAQIWPLGIDFAMGNYVSKPLPKLSYDFSEGAF